MPGGRRGGGVLPFLCLLSLLAAHWGAGTGAGTRAEEGADDVVDEEAGTDMNLEEGGETVAITVKSMEEFAAVALRALLRGTGDAGPNCSMVILADHSDIALHIVKVRVISRCLTVLFATNEPPVLQAMLKQSSAGRLLVWSTHAIIITSLPRSTIMPTIEGQRAFTMMNTRLLLLRHSVGKGYSALVFRHEPYSSKGRHTRMVAYYSPTRGLGLTAPLLHEKYLNFYGANVNFTTLSFPPFFEIKETIMPDGTKVRVYDGTDYKLLMACSKGLNFTPQLLVTETWDQVQDEVAKGNSFMSAIMFFVMPHRLEKYDFTASYYITDLAYAMRIPGIESGWDNFLKPFLTTVWFSILGTVVIIAVCLILVLNNASVPNAISSKLRGGPQIRDMDHKISTTRAMLEVFGAILGQDFTIKMPDTMSFRILIAATFAFIIVLSTGYKSNLIAFMTSPNVPNRIETLAQLVQAKTRVSSPSYGKDHQQVMSKSISEDQRILSTRYDTPTTPMEGFRRTLTHGTVYLDSRGFLDFTIAEHYTAPDGTPKLYVGREGILLFSMGWPIPHDAPFKGPLDRIMLSVFQAGLYKKWHEIELENVRFNRKKSDNPEDDPDFQPSSSSGVNPLTVEQVEGPLWIILCGCLLATLIFGVEVLTGRIKKKKAKASQSN